MSEIGIPQRVADAVRLCEERNIPKFVGFLTSEELSLALPLVAKSRYMLFGGYDGALRTVLGILPDWCESDIGVFPVAALTLTFRGGAELTHRDFLGTLMSLGITRRSVGDILVGNGRAVVFLLEDIVPFVKTQLSKVGGEGVAVLDGIVGDLPENTRFEKFERTVSSERLDCVVAAVCNLSRGAAVEKIEKGSVSVNSVCVQKVTHGVAAGDKLSVRGCGRFAVTDTVGRTKKGKIVLRYKKFI